MNPIARLLAWLRSTGPAVPIAVPSPAPVSTGRAVVACNFVEAPKAVPLGAAAYVISPNGGSLNSRGVEVLVRARRGKWIVKYEAVWRIGCFRLKVLPAPDPRASHDRLLQGCLPRVAADLQQASNVE